MKKVYFLSLLLCLALLSIKGLSAELFLIDQIETVIFGPEDTSIITRSDLTRPALDGQFRTKEQLVLDHLIYQDAMRYNIVDEAMVDRYMAMIQRENNLTLDQIKAMFREYGYTYEEGRQQLSILNTVNSMVDFKIRSKLIVSEKEVRAYYDANPVYSPESYLIMRIFVPFVEGVSREALREEVKNKLKLGETIAGANYSEPFWRDKADLPAEKSFISTLKVNQFSPLQEDAAGIEIFKLLDKRESKLIPFEVRYKEMADKLRKPLYETLFDEYKASLYDNSVIVDF